MEERVTILSDGLNLAGVLHTPHGLGPGERRPAVLILHGFGGSKDSAGVINLAEHLIGWGYVAFRFDFRGCGESEGEHGRVIPFEQVDDTMNALTYMSSRPEVDPLRMALLGNSFGGAVAIYSGGVDERVAAVISSGGWGDGSRRLHRKHSSYESWAKFAAMLEEGRQVRKRTGQSIAVPRFAIVPIPEHLRSHLAASSIMDFPVETAQSMHDFRPEGVVANIAPRPLLLLHSSNDSVTPTEESIDLFKRAGQPADLYLMADVDHFMFSEGNERVWDILTNWLKRYFPVQVGATAVSAERG